jgi:hypothetical protein
MSMKTDDINTLLAGIPDDVTCGDNVKFTFETSPRKFHTAAIRELLLGQIRTRRRS